jgi:hypothetical protein
MEEHNQIENLPFDDKINSVIALNQLVGAIADYYSFKNQMDFGVDDDGEKWKDGPEESIIPPKIDKLIEQGFMAQLKKFA